MGLVAADIFVSVLLRYFFNYSIPDGYDFGRLFLGILIFWGIAATSYRGAHITVDLVWEIASKRGKRVIDVFATLVLLFIVTVQTVMLFDKVTADACAERADLRHAPADLAVLPGGLAGRRVRGDPDRGAHLPASDLRARHGQRGAHDGSGRMSPDTVAILGFVALFVMMLLRVPVGMAMGLVGVAGFGAMTGMKPALSLIGQTSMRTVTDYTFGVIPMFLLMGAFVSNSGMSRELFRAANTFLGHLRGGLGFATIIACAAFAAISGSSVATAATFSTVAYPEMRRFNYPQSIAAGTIAAGGTLGAMFPPSTVLVVYGIITEQDIGKLFMAGIIPGLVAVGMYIATLAADRCRTARPAAAR